MTKRRVLVTGGAGFIGSHLCDRLLDGGDEVIAFDNLSTGRIENISHLMAHPRFTFVMGDVTGAFDFDIDQIFNLACPASPVHYQADPVRTTMTNVLGTLRGLELAERKRARFVQASTSEVYGDPLEHPQRESYVGNVNPIGKRACYDEGKRCAESLISDFGRQGRVDVRIARIFNTYGPRMAREDGRVVTNFIAQALLGEDLTVYGDGRQTRSFCYIDDLVPGLISLMGHPKGPGPVNLGNPEETTVLELAEQVIAMTGSRARVVFRPIPEDDPHKRRPDISKARSLLGFAPKTPLAVGLARTIEDMRARLSTPSAEVYPSGLAQARS